MSEFTELRLGITMRMQKEENYHEIRDALAHDWYPFITKTLPGARWLPVPNMGPGVTEYLKAWQLNAFIITGGNDIKTAPMRDETELAIIKYAAGNQLPLLGICRGLQLICHYHGHAIIPCPSDSHAGTTHKVRLINQPANNRAGLTGLSKPTGHTSSVAPALSPGTLPVQAAPAAVPTVPAAPAINRTNSAGNGTTGIAPALAQPQNREIVVNSYHNNCAGPPGKIKKPLIPFALSEDGLVEGVIHESNPMLGIMWHPERPNPAAEYDIYLIKSLFNTKTDAKPL